MLVDTGWFELENMRNPTASDLAVLRKNLGDTGALEAPSHWDPVVNPSVVQQHPLNPGNKERRSVENAFLSTLRPPHFQRNIEVIQVSRIQNMAMWQSYVVKRQTICYRETGQIGLEDNDVHRKAIERFERKWLFHGSNYEVVDKILQQGFNRSFCGKNATVYGKGVCFARDAAYSAHSTYSVPDSRGRQYMMACRVVVGEYCKGKVSRVAALHLHIPFCARLSHMHTSCEPQQDALTPDIRDRRTQSLFDSTVNNTSDPAIYVTYHDAQAYPEVGSGRDGIVLFCSPNNTGFSRSVPYYVQDFVKCLHVTTCLSP